MGGVRAGNDRAAQPIGVGCRLPSSSRTGVACNGIRCVASVRLALITQPSFSGRARTAGWLPPQQRQVLSAWRVHGKASAVCRYNATRVMGHI